MKRIVTLLCSVSALCIQLNNRAKTLFVQLNQNSMVEKFDSLQSYSSSFANSSACNSEKHMYISIAQNLREGKIYSQKNKDCIFLGWTPLRDDNRMLFDSTKKPLRNDNLGVAFRNVPLYFLIFEEINKTETLLLQRIYYNPTIDITIDVSTFREDLADLATGSKKLLDIEPLKLFDNGRWYLIFSKIFDMPIDKRE